MRITPKFLVPFYTSFFKRVKIIHFPSERTREDPLLGSSLSSSSIWAKELFGVYCTLLGSLVRAHSRQLGLHRLWLTLLSYCGLCLSCEKWHKTNLKLLPCFDHHLQGEWKSFDTCRGWCRLFRWCLQGLGHTVNTPDFWPLQPTSGAPFQLLPWVRMNLPPSS